VTAILAFALLSLAYLALKHWLLLVDERAMGDHGRAYGRLLLKTAATACASVDDMERAAEELGWATRRLSFPHNDTLADEAPPQTLEVWIEPPFPFGKLPFSSFQFDENGCLSPSRP
jgi:hypothetical protein